MMDISENLFLAVDEIIKRRLESVNYDTTIICTIKDNSNAAKNEYTCSNGSAEFKAYSADTTFKIDESVQVMIPNNDYSRQKIIIGRYVAEDGVPFSYTDPFDGLIDVSGNLIDKVEYNKDGYTSLLANHPERKEIVLWAKEFTLPQTKFDLVGVQGYFHTRLGSLDPKYGSYGYRLDIVSQAEKTIDEETKQENDETKLQDITTTFYLDSSDMFGNVYNFQTYIKQEEVYNISNLGKIKKMTLTFYQQPGSFMTDADVAIPYSNEHGNFLDNLFTKDPYVCLGYDLSKFDQEQAILYTINNETYIFDGKDPTYELETNRKTVNLRWLHEYDDGIKVVNNLEGLKDYDIRWYRYRFGASPADQYCGVYWDRVSTETIDKDNGEHFDNFTYIFNPKSNTQTEQIKVIIISPNKELIQSNIMIFTNEGEVVSGATADKTNGLSIWCKDNSEGNYFLYGQNNNLLDLSQANLVRTFEAQFGKEIDGADKTPLTEASEITWTFPFNSTMIKIDGFNYSYKSKIIKAYNIETKKCEINNIDYSTCLIDIEYNTDNTIKKCNIDFKKLAEIDPTGYIFKINAESNNDKEAIFTFDGNFIKITRTRQSEKDDPKVASDYTINILQNYTIKTTYNATALQNNIRCSIKKNNMEYHTEKLLQFGIMSTNGTDTTVVITFDYDKPALTAGKPIEMFPVHANIYDYSHNEIDFTKEDYSDIECHWEWTDNTLNPQGIDIVQKIKYNDNGEIQLDSSIEMNECFLDLQNVNLDITQNHFLILKLTVKNWGNYDLIAYKAVPIRASEEYAMLVGPTEVVYGSTGYADYFKDPYQLKDKNYNTIECNWTIYNPLNNTDEDNDIGKVEKGILKPATMYFKGSKPYGVQGLNGDTKLWIQPLVIIQNNYPSGMLNEWDGESIVLNEDEGQFLAPVIAAGRKNSDNTFSGVMFGDFAKSKSNNSITQGGTGLYGFDDGQLSFGFMEDGTAFIGKSGKGQILFDGKDSIIQSSNWKINSIGMFMDLDDGILKMHNTNGWIFIDAIDSTYPLSIGTDGSSSGNRNFRVKWDGSLYATGAEIHGKLYSDEGVIGGWTINSESIYSGSTYLYSDNHTSDDYRLVIGSGDNQFFVKKEGTIQAVSGTLGGWELDKHELKSKDAGWGVVHFYNDCQTTHTIGDLSHQYWRFVVEYNGQATFGVDRYGRVRSLGSLDDTGSGAKFYPLWIVTDQLGHVGRIYGDGISANIASVGHIRLQPSSSGYLFLEVSDQKRILVGSDLTNSHPIYAYFA